MNRKVILSLLALVMVLSVACQSLNQITPSGMDNAAIEAEVRAKIGEVSASKTFDIGVTVDDGSVTLTGEVDSETTRRQLGDAAGDVKGVKRVINNIRVR